MNIGKMTGSSIETSIVGSSIPCSSIPCSLSTITKPRSTTSIASPGRSGYLDWATQPDPFRRFDGALLIELPHTPASPDVPYNALFDGGIEPAEINAQTVGEFLRCSMGLSAWKQYQASRWALRVNPSSGNLHPTETYLVWGGRVSHYAPREHAIEERCLFDVHAELMARHSGRGAADELLVGLTSIHWREAWKYGERAFRYCQHDLGHAIGALRLAAAGLGWRLALLPRWSDAQIAALLGLDRDGDFEDAEREAPECLAVVTRGDPAADWRGSCAARRGGARGAWHGRANRLSRAHVEWPIIDEVADATGYPGEQGAEVRSAGVLGPRLRRAGGLRAEAAERRRRVPVYGGPVGAVHHPAASECHGVRRASVAAATFLSMLASYGLVAAVGCRRLGAARAPCHLRPPRGGLAPGVYAYLRDPGGPRRVAHGDAARSSSGSACRRAAVSAAPDRRDVGRQSASPATRRSPATGSSASG